jgi:lactate dehydrogenase-like 2-hydroxyacid dehydrogenase
MRPKIFIPQPMSEVAVDRLKKLADVEIYPCVDRIISREELLKGVKEKNYLYALGEIPYTAEVIDAALPSLKGIAAYDKTLGIVGLGGRCTLRRSGSISLSP